MNAIQMFERVLNSGTRTTIYKFGLLIGIVDYIIENPLEPPINNFHFIPLFHLTKQFLAHYFPLILEDIRQGPDLKEKSPTKIRNLILDFVDSKESKLQIPFPLISENINQLISFIVSSENLPPLLTKLLFDIRKIIVDQPLQYIRNVKGDQVSLFGLLSSKDSFQSDYDTHRETGLKLKFSEIKAVENWNELLEKDNLNLFFAHQTFQEISQMHFWFRDVLIKRWAQECIERFDAQAPNLLSLFDLWKKTPERDSVAIKQYRLLYLENCLKICLYSNQIVDKDLQLDHLFPWSRFPVNSY